MAAFIAGGLIALMRLSPYEQDDEDFGIFDRMRSGLDHARDRYPAVPALITVSVLSIFGASHTSLLSVYAELVLGDINTFAWIMMAHRPDDSRHNGDGYRPVVRTVPSAQNRQR